MIVGAERPEAHRRPKVHGRPKVHRRPAATAHHGWAR